MQKNELSGRCFHVLRLRPLSEEYRFSESLRIVEKEKDHRSPTNCSVLHVGDELKQFEKHVGEYGQRCLLQHEHEHEHEHEHWHQQPATTNHQPPTTNNQQPTTNSQQPRPSTPTPTPTPWLRHERMTVAMALAEKLHQTSQGQTNARAEEWGREMNFTATIPEPPSPPHPPPLPSRSSSASTKSSPAVGGQGWERVEWHTLEHRIEPSRLSKCPRSHLHPVVLAGAGFLGCSRRRNCWW